MCFVREGVAEAWGWRGEYGSFLEWPKESTDSQVEPFRRAVRRRCPDELSLGEYTTKNCLIGPENLVLPRPHWVYCASTWVIT